MQPRDAVELVVPHVARTDRALYDRAFRPANRSRCAYQVRIGCKDRLFLSVTRLRVGNLQTKRLTADRVNARTTRPLGRAYRTHVDDLRTDDNVTRVQVGCVSSRRALIEHRTRRKALDCQCSRSRRIGHTLIGAHNHYRIPVQLSLYTLPTAERHRLGVLQCIDQP